MSLRKKFVAGNWKMNKTFIESSELCKNIKQGLDKKLTSDVDVVVFPPFTSIYTVSEVFRDSGIMYGAQNMSYKDDGAMTGEISASMLSALGCEYVILGHSERRQYFHETNQIVNLKTAKALSSGLKPVLCVGETLEQREQGLHVKVVDEQITLCLKGVCAVDMENVIVAYEPVWAIGTGKTASPEQAEEMHRQIRNSLENLFSATIAGRTRILYGGSVTDKNAGELFSMNNIDGGLIGGASLKHEAFIQIINSAL
ncbi:MAG: triose-phosphate isomerase [Ignavibacteriae bacterium]|jgi:triosephosphate isomerase|nr:triose-phosphate isomerase [Ignavibacteriota bacterium]